MPVDEPTVATVVLPLLQLPPGEPSLRVVEKLMQMAEGPVIATGVGLTVT